MFLLFFQLKIWKKERIQNLESRLWIKEMGTNHLHQKKVRFFFICLFWQLSCFNDTSNKHIPGCRPIRRVQIWDEILPHPHATPAFLISRNSAFLSLPLHLYSTSPSSREFIFYWNTNRIYSFLSMSIANTQLSCCFLSGVQDYLVKSQFVFYPEVWAIFSKQIWPYALSTHILKPIQWLPTALRIEARIFFF